MHKMVTMETNGDLMVKMLNSVGYTPDKYLLGLKYVKSSVYYILLKNAVKSHERTKYQKKTPEKSTFTLFFPIIEKKVFY